MGDKPLNIRCKWKAGNEYLSGLTLSGSVGQLTQLVSELTSIPKERIQIRKGFPPAIIDIKDESQLLHSLPFRSGDTIIVEETKDTSAVPYNVDHKVQKQFLSNVKGILMRKVVPADNSCLFTSINILMNEGLTDPSAAKTLRKMISDIVRSDPITYSQAFLAKSNSEYCRWIQLSDSWGGGIELSILSNLFQIEIDVVDTLSGRIDRFGEDRFYSERILIIYNGIHYDPLVMEPLDSTKTFEYRFSTSDETVLVQAMELASEAKAAREYTDVANFTLQCLICQKRLLGNSDAQEHAKLTSHINFGECLK